MRRLIRPATVLLLFALLECVFMERGSGSGDVDMSKAIPLIAQAVPLPPSAMPPKAGQSDVDPHSLFNKKPGQMTTITSFMGAIDPTGTTLPLDFDGDGILNTDETTTSIWVADYPVIDASIAPPVTMQIQLMHETDGTNNTITSELNSSDFQSTKNQGTEKVHRNEVNERTVQFQDKVEEKRESTFGGSKSIGSGSSANSSGTALTDGTDNKGAVLYKAGASLFGVSSGGSSSRSASVNFGNRSGFSKTETKWADRPFKNNLDRTASSVKSDSAAKKARKYRSQKDSNTVNKYRTTPNAGVVRAALYIKNHSINMPVRVTNILCSLMLETPAGELIPVQSFRLRNDDYSLFEIDVYGDTQFGPYVVELSNLNTAEIEKAIGNGYTPKIFIVDYRMTHVADSNYRSQLLHFSGDNLKIVEENAKGRTALIKAIGPGTRAMYRVAAFDTNDTGDVCSGAGVTSIAPGVSLKKALQRIACAGETIEFGNYVFDMSRAVPGLKDSVAYVPGIKKFGGVSTNIPCVEQTSTGSDGVSRTACVVKEFDKWTNDELLNSGIWIIFARGRYYAHSAIRRTGGTDITFNVPASGEAPIPVLDGIDSSIWAGDNIDLVYLRFSDLVQTQQEFGTNPLETNAKFKMNTNWDLSRLTPNPFYPTQNSTFLGVAGLGDRIELTFDLKQTTLLNPDFGIDSQTDAGAPRIHAAYNFDRQVSSKRYSLDQALDFEFSMGVGGTVFDWSHVVQGLTPYNPDTAVAKTTYSCGKSIDYIKQQFTVCIKLPREHDLVSADPGTVNLYLRPRLTNAYRNTVWPMPHADVRQFRGGLDALALTGSDTIIVRGGSGNITAGDTIQIGDDTVSFVVASVSGPTDGIHTITLSGTLAADHDVGKDVYVKGSLGTPQFAWYLPSDVYSNWPADASPLLDQLQQVPLQSDLGQDYCPPSTYVPGFCHGLTTTVDVVNWTGYNNAEPTTGSGLPFWNFWSDASYLSSFLDRSARRYLDTVVDLSNKEEYRRNLAFDVNATAVTDAKSATVNAVSGNKALFAWQSAEGGTNRIRFRAFQFDGTGSTAVAGQPEWYVTTYTRAGGDPQLLPELNPVVAASGTTGIVAWSQPDENKIRVRRVDLNTGVADATGTVFSDISTSRTTHFDIAASNGRAIVAWLQGSTSTPEVRVRIVTLADGSTGPIIRLDTDTPENKINISVKVDGNLAIVTWTRYLGAAQNSVRSRVIDLTTGTAIGATETVVGSIGTYSSAFPHVATSGGRAFILWRSAAGGLNTLVGRYMTLSTATLEGAGDILIHSIPNSEDFWFLNTAFAGNRAIAVWNEGTSTARHTSVRFVDSTTLNVLGPEPIQLIGHVHPQMNPHAVLGNAGIALVLWQSNPPSPGVGGALVQTALVDGNKLERMSLPYGDIAQRSSGPVTGIDFLDPSVSLVGDRVMVSWTAQPQVPVGRPGTWARVIPFDFTGAPVSYGVNNFFTSPLIERDYEIRARIKTD